MALAVQSAFQSNGAFQLAQDQGFQTQLFNVWNPMDPSSGGPWTPTSPPADGPWAPLSRPSGPWSPI